MKSRGVRFALVVPFCVLTAEAVFGSVPGSMEITCDADRKTFRTVAKNQTQVTFRLWNSQTGGSQCGSDHVVLMKDLVVLKERTDRFDAQRPRRFATLRVVLGSDASPVQLCSGPETWLDVTVGSTTLTCDFSADDDANSPPPPPARKRLRSVPFAQPADISARVFNSADILIPDNTASPLTFNTERWDTDNMYDNINPSCLTAQTPGKYMIYANIAWAPNPTGERDVLITLNAGAVTLARAYQPAVTTPNVETYQVIMTHSELSQGDCVGLYVSQNSGGPLAVLGSVGGGNISRLELGLVKLP